VPIQQKDWTQLQGRKNKKEGKSGARNSKVSRTLEVFVIAI
jgi:hypothetical protein